METIKHMTRESKVIISQSTGFQVSEETKIKLAIKSQENKSYNKSSEKTEKILQYVEPPNSFLYRERIKEIKRHKDNHKAKEKINSSYVPMDIGTPKPKERKKSKINDYIHFDLSKLSLFPAGHKDDEKYDDRGYYALKTAATCSETSSSYDMCEAEEFEIGNRNKNTSELGIEIEDHFYEDLNIFPETGETFRKKARVKSPKLNPLAKSPCLLKINEIFSSIRFPLQPRFVQSSNPSNAKPVEGNTVTQKTKIENKQHDNNKSKHKTNDTSKVYHIYENNESSSALYDSIETHFNESKAEITGRFKVSKVTVEEYLQPIQRDKVYADVEFKENDGSLVTTIMKMFENGFRFRKECEKTQDPSVPEKDSARPSISHPIPLDPPERPLETIQKWNDKLRAAHKPEERTNMADRPLPVPVENEFYYMKVDRLEASKLLEGHTDGTFILRPSSQPFHAYTISLVYRGEVHNVGVRRRQDGRLALGFSKRSERSFDTITQLVQHHCRERLLLLVDGRRIGSTRLRQPVGG